MSDKSIGIKCDCFEVLFCSGFLFCSLAEIENSNEREELSRRRNEFATRETELSTPSCR